MTGQLTVLERKVAGRIRWSSRSIGSIILGEGFARICNLTLVIFVSRKFGVRVTGAYALAQTLALYLMQGIDFGLRHIGARLVASDTAVIPSVARAIQLRRTLLAIPVISLGYCYGHFGPVPSDTRTIVSLYAISMVGYAFSLDWLAWGMKRFGWVSGWRSLVSFIGAGVAILAVELFHVGPTIIALANGVGYATAAYVLWTYWARHIWTRKGSPGLDPKSGPILRWSTILVLGAAMIVNQVFSSIDIIMLGSLTDSTQVGLYSAAYRTLLLVLAVYYMAIESIYPELAAIPGPQRGPHTLWRSLWKLMLIGIGITIAMELLRRPLILMFYGAAFTASVRLSVPILISIPLELGGAFLLTAMIAWDRSSMALLAASAAALSNILLNFWLIPRYGAMGAAYATPLSYGVFLIALLVCSHKAVRSNPRLTTDSVASTCP
ncbi:MAG TPA: polysaccharide biosynthesis C-terminal domain-containing protein [Acidobacteriaceae bacterium]